MWKAKLYDIHQIASFPSSYLRLDLFAAVILWIVTRYFTPFPDWLDYG